MKIIDVNLFNDTDIIVSTDTNKSIFFLVPTDFSQVVTRVCVPFYTRLEGADVSKAIFEYIKVCEVYIF